jgi:hypothetical protein
MSVSGYPFVVTNVVDGAAPVIKSVCFEPAPGGDTLHVVFSEPLAGTNLDPFNIFSLYIGNVIYSFANSNPPVTVIKNNDNFVYVFKPNTMTTLDSLVEPGRPTFYLTLCGAVSIIVTSHAAGNPFNPQTSIIPQTQRPNAGDPDHGTRVEVVLIKAVEQELAGGKIKGTITILDAVGNMVIDKKDLEADNPACKLYWIWDGKTKKGSWAAPGTYLARIEIDDNKNNKKEHIKMYLGVKGSVGQK